MAGLMDITVPLLPMLGLALLLCLVAAFVVFLLIYMGVPQLGALWRAGIGKKDILISSTPTDMWIEVGNKKHKSDIMYNPSGLLKKGPLNKMDPSKFDPGNGVRWGNSTVRFYYPGKAFPKNIARSAAQQTCLRIAQKRIPKEGKGSIPDDDKANHVIQYNEHFCVVAQRNPAQAGALLIAPEEELPSLVSRFAILPEEIKPTDADFESKAQAIVDQLYEEILMVREHCRDLLVPPTIVALPEMMASYPDAETTDEMIERLDAERIREARKGSAVEMKWVILGLVGEAVLFVIAIIALQMI